MGWEGSRDGRLVRLLCIHTYSLASHMCVVDNCTVQFLSISAMPLLVFMLLAVSLLVRHNESDRERQSQPLCTSKDCPEALAGDL